MKSSSKKYAGIHDKCHTTLPIKYIYLKCNIKLIRIINGDYTLVSCLILQVEINLDREHKHWNLSVQDTSTTRAKR